MKPEAIRRDMNRLEATFNSLKADGEKALIAYIMAGDPSLRETEQLVLEMERSGADVIELGVPFSDPIADGPVIQQAADRALRGGTTLRKILESVRRLRASTQIPIVLMAYYNTVHAFGTTEFCREAVRAGVDGLIVPDMPPDESEPLQKPSRETGLNLIFLLAPTSTPARRGLVTKQSQGFLYYVSLTGITGTRLHDVTDVRDNVRKIKQQSRVPIAVGFGVATSEDAARVAKVADGVIVGTAIVRNIAQHAKDPRMVSKVGEFVRSLKTAMHPA